MTRLSLTLFLVGAVAVGCAAQPGTTTNSAPAASTSHPTTTIPSATTSSWTTTTTGSAQAAFPVEVAGVRITARPERVVSLSATHTEMLYAIGAGGQVIATDQTSNYPQQAQETKKVDSFEPNVEAIAALRPDLVLVWFDPGDLVASLRKLEVPTMRFETAETLEDTYAQIEQLGAATGHVGEAAELVGRMQSQIEEMVASAPAWEEAPSYYHELDTGLFTITSDTFAGRLYERLGLVNIADSAEAGQYPQLSAEFVIQADPDFIFLADTKCCGVSAATVAERPGWDTLTAVQEGRVVELDDDVASRWGPRVVDFLRTVAQAVAQFQPVG